MPFSYEEATNKEAIDHIVSPSGVWRNIASARATAVGQLESIADAKLPASEEYNIIVEELFYVVDRCDAALESKQTQLDRNPRIADVAAILQWREVGTDREGYTSGRPNE